VTPNRGLRQQANLTTFRDGKAAEMVDQADALAAAGI
jgi:hypothetical protein